MFLSICKTIEQGMKDVQQSDDSYYLLGRWYKGLKKTFTLSVLFLNFLH